MKRPKLPPRVLKILLLIVVISPLSVFFGFYLTLYLQTPVPHVAWVSWYGNPQEEVYIGWETEEATTGIVKYGLSSESLSSQEAETSSGLFHIVNLTSLSADTKYYYAVEIAGNVYARGEFRTAPNPGASFSFVLTADTQPKVGPGWISRWVRTVAPKNYSFIGFVGDIVEEGYKAEWNFFFSEMGALLDTIPIVPVRGNHDRPKDVDDDGSDEYYFPNYFPQTVDAVKDTNSYDTYPQFYYSFNWSSVHVQVLHFPEIDIDDSDEVGGVNPRDYYQAFTADHLDWLKQDLKNAQSLPFRVTLFHCPITSAGFYGPNHVLLNELLPILLEHNVTMTVHGHAHHYERGVLTNETLWPGRRLTYFVVGTGGGLADIGLRPVPETITCAASPCFTEVQATSSSLTVTAYNLDGDVVDTCTIPAGGG